MKTPLFICIFCLLIPLSAYSSVKVGIVKTVEIRSKLLSGILMGNQPKRTIQIYLPSGYEEGNKRYPSIYYIPNFSVKLEEFAPMLDLSIESEHIEPHIFVSGDFSIPNHINFMGNNEVVGHWLDFIQDEWVPYVDHHFRTIKRVESRGIAGHFLGGYAAIKTAMFNPDLFSSVYAFHPVGTSTGEKSSLDMVDWENVHSAKTVDDLKGFSAPFVGIAQAYLPNPKRPPFYADMMVEMEDGELKPQPQNIAQMFKAFALTEYLFHYTDNLDKLRAIKFDWGRKDSNMDHVYANRKLTEKLSTLGIEHEALEHNGTGWDYRWDETGYFYQHMLPFFSESLDF